MLIELNFSQIVKLPQENAQREIAGETEERAELPKPMKMFGFFKLKTRNHIIFIFCSQLPKETWFDLLAFVPRHQLGEIAPQVGDRKFAVILQSFLHNYGQITLDNIWIGRPRPKDRRLYVRSWSKSYDRIHANLELPDVELPKNIKNFLMIELGFAFYEIKKIGLKWRTSVGRKKGKSFSFLGGRGDS
jgi:hypothetical protein